MLRRISTALTILGLILVGVSCGPSETVPRSKTPASEDLLLCSTAGRIFTFNVENGSYDEIKMPEGTGSCGPVWAPDRRTIACVSGRLTGKDKDKYIDPMNMGLWLLDVDGKQLRELAHGDVDYRTGHVSWSPDGNLIYLSNTSDFQNEIHSGSGGLIAVDMKGSVYPVASPTTPGDRSTGNNTFSISPDARHIARPTGNGDAIEVFKLNRKKVGDLFSTFRLSPPGPAYSPSSPPTRYFVIQPVWLSPKELVVVDDEMFLQKLTLPSGETRDRPWPYRSALWKWNIETGERSLLLQSDPHEIFSDLTVSPSRDAVAFLCQTISDVLQEGIRLLQEGESLYESGKEPRPAILYIKSCEVTRYETLPSKDLWLIDLNWSSP